MDGDPDDRSLFAAWRTQGDQQAYHRLVLRHAGRVENVCRRITGDTQLAQDAAQAVFLILARKGRRLPPETVLVAWLHITARHIALRARREAGRRRCREAVAGRRWDDMATTSADPRLAELGPELDEALAALGREEREAILLRHVSGLDWEALATALGVARNTAEKRVSRGLERLRSLLARRGFAVASAAIATALAQDAAAGEPAWAAGWTPAQATSGSPAAALAQTGKPIWPTAIVAATLTIGLAVGALAARHPDGTPPVRPPADPPTAEPPPAAGTPRILVRTGHTGSPWALRIAASADGRYLATSDMFQGELRVWDGRDPQRLVLAMSTDASAVAFAPDGASFAVLGFRGEDAITRWSLPEGRLLGTIKAPGIHTNGAELHALDAGHLLANQRGQAVIHALDGTPAVVLAPLTADEVRRRDELEQQIAALRRPGIKERWLGDPRDRFQRQQALQQELDGLQGGPFGQVLVRPVQLGKAIAVLPNGHLWAKTPTICDAATGAFLRRCEERHPVNATQEQQVQSSLLTTPDGTVVGVHRRQGLGGQKNRWQITLWDPASGMELAHREGTANRWEEVVADALLLPDRKVLLLRRQGNLLWRWNDQSEPEPGPAGDAIRLASPDGSRLAVVQGQKLGLLDVASGRLHDWGIVGRQERADAASVAVSPGGRFAATASPAGTLHVWDLAAVQLKNSASLPPADHGAGWIHLGFAADARRLFAITASDLAPPDDRTRVALHTWDPGVPLPEPWWQGAMKRCSFYANGIALAGSTAWVVDGNAVRHFDMAGMRVLASRSLPAAASQHLMPSWAIRGVDARSGAIFVDAPLGDGGPGLRLDPDQADGAPATTGIVACATSSGWRVVLAAGDGHGKQLPPRLLGPPGRPDVDLPPGFAWQFDATGSWFTGITTEHIVVGALPAADAPATAVPEIRFRLPLRLVSPTCGFTVASSRDGYSHHDLRLLPGGKGMLCGNPDGLVLVDVTNGTEILRLRAWPDGCWLAMAPDGVYDGSDDGMRRLSMFDAAGREMALEEMRRLRKPDELRRRMAGYVVDGREGAGRAGAEDGNGSGRNGF